VPVVAVDGKGWSSQCKTCALGLGKVVVYLLGRGQKPVGRKQASTRKHKNRLIDIQG